MVLSRLVENNSEWVLLGSYLYIYIKLYLYKYMSYSKKGILLSS